MWSVKDEPESNRMSDILSIHIAIARMSKKSERGVDRGYSDVTSK